jgi:alanyl-tRNA synthetase
MIETDSVRSTFLNYFAAQGHTVLPSASLVPKHDPTLLFVNAGMVPFKNALTGLHLPTLPLVASSQKCVRAGGRHNDLENVGYTARHHTFFEMLGNFSFGDYFKEGAIRHAWILLTEVFKIPPEKLCVTVYHTDDEASALWKQIAGLPDEKIIRITTNDNFWSMGDTGPCGPCSAIFYDHGAGIPGGPPGSLYEDGDRFVQIWNLVFVELMQHADGSRTPLRRPSVETGMGLERLTAVLQGVHDNYEIDLFRTLIVAIEDITGTRSVGDLQMSHRVIADHLRSTSFLIADGVSPSNEGRGYVLRRIMRRAMRHAYLLGAEEPLMHRLVAVLVAEMGEAYPELQRAEQMIVETLRKEEERFRRRLGRGMALLDEATADTAEGGVLPGDLAFDLYDNYGFPLDFIQDAVRAKGLTVDIDAFDLALQLQRDLTREHRTGSDPAAAGEWLAIRQRLGRTEFLGFESTEAVGQLKALVSGATEVAHASADQIVFAVFDRSPFYAESDGQAGDTGEVEWTGGKGRVLYTQEQAGDLIVHELEITEGVLGVGTTAHLVVDADRRQTIRANHSAAHLVHAALRNILGPHVSQTGQMVDDECMRFDFRHGAPLTTYELERIEASVNGVIRQNIPTETKLAKTKEAIEAGALVPFGEPHGDMARVVRLGRSLADPDKPYSLELCRGTHVLRTGEIGHFKVISEAGVARGIRRVEGVTRQTAKKLRAAEISEKISAAIDASPQDPNGAKANIISGRVVLDFSLGMTDGDALNHPLSQSLIPAIRSALRGLDDLTGEIEEDRDWRGLSSTVSELRRSVDRNDGIDVAEIGTIWALTVALASFAEQDGQVKLGLERDTKPLPVYISRPLSNIVSYLSAWIRLFPTISEIDNNIAGFNTPTDLAPVSTRTLEDGLRRRIIDPRSASIVININQTASRDSHQSTKARNFSIVTTRNVLIAGAVAAVIYAGSNITGGFFQEIGSKIADNTVLDEQFSDWFRQNADDILQLVSEAPADVRVAVSTAVEAAKVPPTPPES